MPGFILHSGATVLCVHGGQAQPTVSDPQVLVSGQPVVTQASTYSIVACGLTGTSNPPCATAQWVSFSVRVKVNGASVLLKDSRAVCSPTGTGLNVIQTQMRVRGI